jgi:hypothetical protein
MTMEALQRKMPSLAHPIPFFASYHYRPTVMNTAMARRLALGDRVVWIGKDGYQFTGPGTITRITAHEVEVRWDSEIVTRYRRVLLHNLLG